MTNFMTTRETLERAMSHRQNVSFQLNRLGKTGIKEVKNAHIISISTRFGKQIITVYNTQNSRVMLGCNSFDLNEISQVKVG